MQVATCNFSSFGNTHDDVIKWKHFPRYWSFVRGIHRPAVNSPHKGRWRGALMFSLICAWINRRVNNREAGDLRRHRSHYDVILMPLEKERLRTCIWKCYIFLDVFKAIIILVCNQFPIFQYVIITEKFGTFSISHFRNDYFDNIPMFHHAGFMLHEKDLVVLSFCWSWEIQFISMTKNPTFFTILTFLSQYISFIFRFNR